MASNEFNPYNTNWSMADWQNLCQTGCFRRLRRDEFPPLSQPMLDKVNMAFVCASGNSDVTAYLFQMYRVEEKRGQIDEHQYLEVFDNVSGEKKLAGIIDHPHPSIYPERTIKLNAEALNTVAVSGVKVDFDFDREVQVQEGTLEYLRENGFLRGFEVALKIAPTGHMQ